MREKRLQRERKTIEKMMHIFCKSKHNHGKQLCEKCQKQLDYAFQRIDHCPFKEKKPACKKCNIHCYKPDMAHATREIMRFSGPRMLFYHPILATWHMVDLMRF
ncbi:MAG: nitrous oxide-stimulated promoter family protein [Bacteroidota bacterium]|nr:nitrous oxide-stimulated promoter family protein [Bacteroidota bacterium]